VRKFTSRPASTSCKVDGPARCTAERSGNVTVTGVLGSRFHHQIHAVLLPAAARSTACLPPLASTEYRVHVSVKRGRWRGCSEPG